MKHTRKRNRLEPEIKIIGCDSETMRGPPISFQFYSEHAPQINGCAFVDKHSPMKIFLKQLKKLPRGCYRMYGHNLEFDLLSFLWDARREIVEGNVMLTVGDWEILGRYSKPIFCVFDDGTRRIELIDSFLWFMTSLDNAAKRVCPDLPKLLRPAGLGERLFTSKDDGFVAYAMRDAVIAFHLGVAIQQFHIEQEIPSQISLASMAATVFRLRYMREDIYQPPTYQWMLGAASSYHGGVNRVRPGAELTWHMNTTALDVSSAYPEAMSHFPPFSNPKGYRDYKPKDIRKLSTVPDLGVYKISGSASVCDWPALFSHNFKPLAGPFTDTWVSGYELNQALETDEVKLTACRGYTYDQGDYSYSPFNEFVSTLYDLKSSAKDPVMRYMYKIELNGLTGKFIQTSPDWTLVDGQLTKINRAGGLYHPFIASMITGFTRGKKMHPLEHRYNAIHTATDGIFAGGRYDGAQVKTLGAIVSEGNGDLALLRNKLYIFYTDKQNENTYESEVFSGRHILKCARHGYQGSVATLESMLVSTNRSYKVNKPNKLKSSIQRGLTPNEFLTTERKLNVGTDFKVVRYNADGSYAR